MFDLLDVVLDDGQQLEPLARCADPERLEVTTPDTNVGVDPVGVLVEVQERFGPEVEVGSAVSEIFESIDRPEGMNEFLVAHAAHGGGRVVVSRW